MSVKKRILEVTIFLLVMFLTFYTLFSGKNLGEIAKCRFKNVSRILGSGGCSCYLFVCAEGYMIWYLASGNESKTEEKEGSSLIRCIQYSFIGFFYSGITPSATGGQPVQPLIYEQRFGNRGSDSTLLCL